MLNMSLVKHSVTPEIPGLSELNPGISGLENFRDPGIRESRDPGIAIPIWGGAPAKIVFDAF